MNFAKTSVEILKITRCSKLFQPTNILPNVSEPSIKPLISKSQKLMLDMGIIRQSNAGIFYLLPLGVRSMYKLKSMIRRHLNRIEAQEVKMPVIADASLWRKSGRWDTTGSEVFKLKDRRENEFILSPTNEESATDLIAALGQLSNQQLPILLYQIALKFRDEIRPRCGLFRTKEFEMMDAYSFDESLETSQSTYGKVSTVLECIFNHLELPFIKVLADSGNMGGELSHEYHLVSDAGEDTLNICEVCSQGINSELSTEVCPSCGSSSFKQITGIEVGHTFLLGTRYSLPLECKFRSRDGKMEPLMMGSYGLGLTRILAASLELLSTDEEIRWPLAMAPFSVCIIPPKEGSKEWDTGSALSLDLCKELERIFPDDVLLDDRCKQSVGKRLRHARRTGYPYIVCIGKGITRTPPLFELISLDSNTTEYLTFNNLLKYFETLQNHRNLNQAII